MKIFVSERGLRELWDLRIGSKSVPAVQGSSPVELLAHVPSEECGCPEEIWQIDGVIVLIHFEDDGTSEMFVFYGDGEFEASFRDCENMNALRAKMFETLSKFFGSSDD